MSLIDELIARKRIIITCGTGGVGKTTLSAAIAARAAEMGRRSIVITIDPAKRLATSLGIKALGDEPCDLTPRLKTSGTLHALMPDTRKTFETLVQDLGFDQAGSDRVLNNPIFKIFAKEFSGTNEYMAMQRLYSIHCTGHAGHEKPPFYDTIVLDTPPSRNTLDFLDAPRLLARFYEDKVFQWLISPASFLFSGGIKHTLGILEKLTGGGFVTHLISFATSLLEVKGAFTSNLTEVVRMLESDQTGFLLVASPSVDHLEELEHFIESIKKHRFQFEGIVLNRSFTALNWPPTPDQDDPGMAILTALRSREQVGIKTVTGLLSQWFKTAPQNQPVLVPELARDVHSVEDLMHVAHILSQA